VDLCSEIGVYGQLDVDLCSQTARQGAQIHIQRVLMAAKSAQIHIQPENKEGHPAHHSVGIGELPLPCLLAANGSGEVLHFPPWNGLGNGADTDR
jgi:hypothetical protein